MLKDIQDKNIILFGVGAVQKCVLHYLEKYLIITPSNLLMIDLIDYRNDFDIKKWIDKGAKYIICDINKEYKTIISKMNEYDIIIDLTNRTESNLICEECLKNNIHYINTSLEDKESPNEIKKKFSKFEQSYQQSHNEILTLKNRYKDKATNMLNCGMNPGCITLLTKLAILEMAKKQPKNTELQLYINERDYARLCEYLEIEIIHCSEVDTITFDKPNFNDTYYNTWCCQAFLDEYADNLQMTYGTEQKTLPPKAEMINDYVVNMNKPSYELYSESYCPKFGKFVGCCISHSEQISGADYFSTAEHSPSIYYVYRFSPLCWNSIKHLTKDELGGTLKKKSKVVSKLDKISGVDFVGSLIISKKHKSIWCGSLLTTEDKHIGNHSPTTAQVAISILSFIHWMLDNKNKGANFAENVDEQYFLQRIKPYFKFYIEESDYNPKSIQFKDLQKDKKQFDNQYK